MTSLITWTGFSFYVASNDDTISYVVYILEEDVYFTPTTLPGNPTALQRVTYTFPSGGYTLSYLTIRIYIWCTSASRAAYVYISDFEIYGVPL
jgi:hypothetical protein